MRNKKTIFNFIIATVIVLPFLVLPASAQVQRADAPPTGFEAICNQALVKSQGLAGCINKIYLFSLGLGALIALLMLVTAGYRYMTAAGNAEQVQTAKDTFVSTFTGLIIIFIAFILLYLINPDLVQLNTLRLPKIEIKTGGSAGGGGGAAPPPPPPPGGGTGSAINISTVGLAASYGSGSTATITFTASPSGSYSWTFDDCAGDQLPDGLTYRSANPPVISGTVSVSAIEGTYNCQVSVSGGGRSGSAEFQIVVAQGNITIVVVPAAPAYARGGAANISFVAAPGGTYTWTFDDCAGDDLPRGLTISGLGAPSETAPRITGTVANDALASPPPYSCRISATGQGRSGSKDFQIVISP